jgi:hypothetical protein
MVLVYPSVRLTATTVLQIEGVESFEGRGAGRDHAWKLPCPCTKQNDARDACGVKLAIMGRALKTREGPL